MSVEYCEITTEEIINEYERVFHEWEDLDCFKIQDAEHQRYYTEPYQTNPC